MAEAFAVRLAAVRVGPGVAVAAGGETLPRDGGHRHSDANGLLAW